MQGIKAYAIASCLGLLGLAIVPQAKADEWNQKTTLRVNQPVMIPGMTLQPGDYVLQLAPQTLSNRNIVQVFNSDESELLATVIAVPHMRTTVAGGSQFTFWEMPAGQPPALRTWYFPGDNVGHEFTYPKHVASQIAQYNRKNVPAYAEQTPNLKTATLGTVTPSGEFRATTAAPVTAATATAQYTPRTDESQAYAPIPGCATATTAQPVPPPAERPTVTAQVLPPYPIPTEQPVPAEQPVAPAAPAVKEQQPITTQPCECPPSTAAVTPTVQPETQQPMTQPQPEAQAPAAATTICPPGVAVQPMQPRTDEATEYENQTNEMNETQPAAQPCECPPAATVTQPGVSTTVQPAAPAATGTTTGCPPSPSPATTGETGVTAQPQAPAAQTAPAAAPTPAPCQCPGPTSEQMQTNTNVNTAATPMVNHMCC